MYAAQIKDNKVIGIIVVDSFEVLKTLSNINNCTFEMYDTDIHPWGPYGQCDVEVGLGWRTRLKEKVGYCIFCGDCLPVPEESGSL
jgi:hypothetical protein